MAINRNLAAENYGVAANLIKVLLRRKLPDHDALVAKHKKCQDSKFVDAHPLEFDQGISIVAPRLMVE